MKRITKYIIFIILLASAVFLLWKTGTIAYQNKKVLYGAFSNTFNAKPEPFTELYFENNENLPQKITNNQKFTLQNPTLALFTFKFDIHNLENKDKAYPYEVFTLIDGEKTLIDKGSIFVKKNETKTTSESFPEPKIFPKTEIVVNLLEKNQQISFWMEIKK